MYELNKSSSGDVFVLCVSAVCDGACVEKEDAGVREVITDGRLTEGG